MTCVVPLTSTVPTVAPVSPHTPVIEATVAVWDWPSYVTVYGVTVTAASAFPIVSELLPLLAASDARPAKLAPTPEVYVPALIPQRLTPDSVATPLPLVVALPT